MPIAIVWITANSFKFAKIIADIAIMENKSYCAFLLALFLMFFGPVAQSQNVSKGISFQGVIKTPRGQFPTISGTSVVVKILSPNNCILREESFSSVNISNGYLNLVIGRGTPTASNPSPARDLKSIMNNSSAFTNLTCLNIDGSVNALTTSYDPHVGDLRKLRISMQIDQDSVVADFNMRAVAYAVNAESLNGKSESSFINVNSVDGLTQANAESIFQRYTQLDNILNGSFTGNVTGNVSGNVNGNVSGTASNVTGVVAVVNGGTGANSAVAARTNLGIKGLALIDLPSPIDTSKFLRGDGTWASVVGGVSTVAGRGGDVLITTADLADFNTAADARATGIVNGLKGQMNGLASLDAGGKVPSGQLALTSADIPNIDAAKINSGTLTVNVNSSSVNAGVGQFTQLKVNDGTGKVVTMSRQAGGADYSIQWPANVGAAGSVLQTDAMGILSWVAIPSAPVQSVAGRTGTVVLAKEDISGLGTAAALNVGTSANNLVQLDSGAKIPASLLPDTVLTTSASAGGDVTGIYSNLVLVPSGVTPGSYTKIVVDAKGRVVEGSSITSTDIPNLDWSKITSGKPTTVSGFGITDAITTTNYLSDVNPTAACTAKQKPYWNILGDTWGCVDIGNLDASALDSGTIDLARLPSSVKSWDSAVGGINYSGGNLGVGTSVPAAKLHVEGGIRAQQICDTNGNNCKTISDGWRTNPSVGTLTEAANIAVDGAVNDVFKITLTGNRNMSNPTNLVPGKLYTFQITQDASGNRNLTWGDKYIFSPGSSGAVGMTASKTTVLLFSSDGTSLYNVGAVMSSTPCTSAASVYGTVGPYQVTVPVGCTKAVIKAWGAGGGNSGSNYGGAGAYASATFIVSPGETLTVQVGGAGGDNSAVGSGGTVGGGQTAGGGGGGYGGGGGGSYTGNAGGGGRSAVYGSSVASDTLLIAGGGGGATSNAGGGAGGGTNGQKGAGGYGGGGATGSTGGIGYGSSYIGAAGGSWGGGTAGQGGDSSPTNVNGGTGGGLYGLRGGYGSNNCGGMSSNGGGGGAGGGYGSGGGGNTGCGPGSGVSGSGPGGGATNCSSGYCSGGGGSAGGGGGGNIGAGGGGGGYAGGAGGGNTGGGGGGSSFLFNVRGMSGGTMLDGNYATPGNASDPSRGNSGNPATDGKVVITWQ